MNISATGIWVNKWEVGIWTPRLESNLKNVFNGHFIWLINTKCLCWNVEDYKYVNSF